MEILLAEDDRICRTALRATLERAGYAVRAVANGAAALEQFRARRPDAIVLDVMMPGMDGLAACSALRRLAPTLPIVFLTALDAEADELRGRGLGADDYIPKTVSDAVLLARLASVLRRAYPDASAIFAFGTWKVNPARANMTLPTGASVDLTEREIALLRLFAAHPGEVFSRDFLLTRFWGSETLRGEGALNTALHTLRAKLGRDAARLESVWGRGVRFRPAP